MLPRAPSLTRRSPAASKPAPCSEAYGLEHSADRFGQTFLRPTTPIPNLYFSGQDAACCGVAGGAIAAFLTASTIDLRVPVQHAGTLAAMATASM